MDDVLSERLAALQRGVEEVEHFQVILGTRSQGLDDMSLAASKASFIVEDVRKNGEKLSAKVKGGKDRLERVPLDQRANLSSLILDSIGSDVDALIEPLKEIETAIASVAEEANDLARLTKQQRAEEFVDRVADQVSIVRDNLNRVRGKIRAKDSVHAWGLLGSDVMPPAEQLFADYLGLLGGISILESGMTLSQSSRIDALCDMSHILAVGELAKSVTTRHLSPLMLPASAGITRLRILGLGVGQWSIWGLPIVAHQYGRLMQVEGADLGLEDLPEVIEELGTDGIPVLAADVFAAWALGPAYAAALIHVKLDPRDAPRIGFISDLDRAVLMHHVLLDDRRGTFVGEKYTDEFVSPLLHAWDHACDEAGTKRVGSERVELLSSLAISLRDRLMLQEPFSTRDWRLARGIGEWLGSLAPQARQIPPEMGLRHILNAAWWARLKENRPAIDVERAAMNLATAYISGLTKKTYVRGAAPSAKADVL